MKRNQKGFTLIELLAVIVILAIIALIATPMVLKYIEQSRKGAAESDAYAAIKAAELYYANTILETGSAPAENTVNVTALDLKNKDNMTGTLTLENASSSGEATAVLSSGFKVGDYTCTQSGDTVNCDK